MSYLENLNNIKVIYRALKELSGKVVFVGGATVSLYADRPSAEVRPTKDVDILIELLQYRDYTAIKEDLRKKGFINDTESGVICRYKIDDVIVDIMPTTENPLGFTNTWYEDGFSTAIEYSLEEGLNVRIFKPIYFLASKLEAFNSRGGGDGRTSSDFEDIIFILNNRLAIWHELNAANENVLNYLKNQFNSFLQNIYIEEWISAHLESYEQRRVRTILEEMNKFVSDKLQVP